MPYHLKLDTNYTFTNSIGIVFSSNDVVYHIDKSPICNIACLIAGMTRVELQTKLGSHSIAHSALKKHIMKSLSYDWENSMDSCLVHHLYYTKLVISVVCKRTVVWEEFAVRWQAVNDAAATLLLPMLLMIMVMMMIITNIILCGFSA